jgi:hypothetical protein
MAVNFAKLPDLLRRPVPTSERDEDAAAHSRVRAMSACARTADVSLQCGEPPLRAKPVVVDPGGHNESYDGVNVKPSSIQPVTPPIIIFTGKPSRDGSVAVRTRTVDDKHLVLGYSAIRVAVISR